MPTTLVSCGDLTAAPRVEVVSKKRFLSDLSWIQVVAGAAAAVLAAWLASTFSVTGTLMGAAVGSVVASIGSTFIRHTLETGRDFVVVPDGRNGVTVEELPADEVDPLTRAPKPWFNWRNTVTVALLALAIAVTAIVGYELVTGHSFGGHQSVFIPEQSQPATPSSTPTASTSASSSPTSSSPSTSTPSSSATSSTPTSSSTPAAQSTPTQAAASSTSPAA
jgi:hypothetical protein